MPSTTKADDLTINFPPHRGVDISKTALWASWKEVRKRARDSSWRDIVDFAEFDIEPDKWIAQLLVDLRTGRYQPQHPRRFPLAKSKGFSRWMTLPDIRDVVLFHCIATRMAGRAGHFRKKPRHVYFMRDRISKVQDAAEAEAQAEAESGYLSRGQAGFRNWLRMHQYRRHLIFKKVYPYIVKTDISNFFDSIAHSQIEAFLYELGFSRNIVGLLLLLLERLSIRDAYAGAPRIGLPVDEFDCSRCLAHVVLFPHDDRMVEIVGEDAYLRWMDDQDFGLNTLGECYRLLAELNASLRRMHLTPNAAKTKILTVAQARREIHFVTNDRLDAIDAVMKQAAVKKAEFMRARAKFRLTWSQARKDEGVGEWSKIVKRCYRLAGRLGLRTLVASAHERVLGDPPLAEYIARYLRAVCSAPEFVDRMTAILSDERNVYDDVKRIFAEELLRIESGDAKDRAQLRKLAVATLTGRSTTFLPRDVAALILLRFGTKHSLRTLRTALEASPNDPAARAISLVLASFGGMHRAAVISLAQTTLRSPLNAVALFLRVLEEPASLARVGRMKNRLQPRFDSLTGRKYIDMRTVLQARLMQSNPSTATELSKFIDKTWRPIASAFELALLDRVFP